MDPTTINTIVTIIGIVVGIIGLSVLYIEKRKREIVLLEAINKTIAGINNGRGSKIAIYEDFTDHKRLCHDLLPYIPCKRNRLKKALKEYENWYNTIKESGIIGILSSDWQPEIEETESHLLCLKKIIE